MESDRDVVETLRQAERAAAAPYVDYPATPAWYPIATGLWAAAFCFAMVISDDSPLRAVVLLALVAVEIAFLAWYRRRRGVWPRGRAPEEIRGVLLRFVLGAAAVVGIVGATLWLLNPWVAAVVAVAVVTPSVAWYERAYAAAAERVRVRLG